MELDKRLKELPWPDTYNGGKDVMYRVTAQTPVIRHERILVVTFTTNQKFKKDSWWSIPNPEDTRCVCSKKQPGYAIFRYGGMQMRNALREVLGVRNPSVEIQEQDSKRIRSFLGSTSDEDPIELLYRWTEEEKEAKRRNAAAARGEMADEDYSLCPEQLPDGLEDWIRRQIIAEDKVIIYKHGNTRGLCYCCGEKIRAQGGQRFRQYSFAVCPNCGEKLLCILEGSDHFRNDYVENFVFPQMGLDGKTVFFRQFHLKRDPTAQWKTLTPFIEEFGRYAFRGNKTAKWLREYKENYCMNTYRYSLNGWERFKGMEVFDGSYYFWGGPLPEAVKGTKLQYADLEGYNNGTVHRDRNVVRYAADFVRYPVMEFLWKAGYRQVVSGRVSGLTKDNRNAIRWSAGKLKDCFKFPLRLLKNFAPGEWTLNKIQKLNELWTFCPGKLSEREVMQIIAADLDYEYIQSAFGHANIHKIIAYLSEQQQAHEEKVEIAYRDYLRECGQLNLNLDDERVLFPRDLVAAHVRTMNQINYEEDRALQEKFEQQLRKLNALTWERDGLLIRPARSQAELQIEGKMLHHCVAGYAPRMANGSTAIFFVRRVDKPSAPFFTLELRGKEVVQCRTLDNSSYENNQEIKNFVDAWLEKVVQKGTKKRSDREVTAA